MPAQEKTGEKCNEEKAALKLKFENIINKYSMFEGVEHPGASEKLRLRLAKTKEELHKIIAAL